VTFFALVGVLNHVCTRLIDGDFELLDHKFGQIGFMSMFFHKAAHRPKVTGRAGDSRAMDGARHEVYGLNAWKA